MGSESILDRIYRINRMGTGRRVKKKLKPETGDRKGRGEQLVKDAEILDGGLWIGDSAAVAVNLISTAYRPTGFF